MAVSILMQIWWGHRLPLVIGPTTVLLIGTLASQTSSPVAIYSIIMIFGSWAYFLINPTWIQETNTDIIPMLGGFFHQLTTDIILDPGVIIAFLLCFLGLDSGSRISNTS